MKATELRIGNWAFYPTVNLENGESILEAFKVQPSDIVQQESIPTYEPIPLTEEWLVKSGFEKIKHIHLGYIFVHKLVKIVVYPNGMIELRGAAGWAKIEYVHSLQNLYFALTGEELTIKE